MNEQQETTRPQPSERDLLDWARSLREREAAPATIEKYLRDASRLVDFLGDKGLGLEKDALLAYKELLVKTYAPTSVNSMLAAVNGFVGFLGRPELRVRRLRVQRGGGEGPHGLNKEEYRRLVRAARNRDDERMSLAIQTICSTGVRASELASITVDAVRRGFAEITNKGKTRRVWLPEALCRTLLRFSRRCGRGSGPVFVTRSGRALDRTRIWRKMKEYARAAQIDARKVFPHALRHLFATTFYRLYHDIDVLSRILGHSSVETTRVYIAGDQEKTIRQITGLGLLM